MSYLTNFTVKIIYHESVNHKKIHIGKGKYQSYRLSETLAMCIFLKKKEKLYVVHDSITTFQNLSGSLVGLCMNLSTFLTETLRIPFALLWGSFKGLAYFTQGVPRNKLST